MYKNFNELKVGSIFYQWRTYVGFVEFEVVEKVHYELVIESKSMTGYDFRLTEEAFNQFIEKDRRFYFFKTYDGAMNDKNKRDAARQKEYVEQFKNDKEAFFVELLKKAFLKEIDGEYGDYVEAMAIKELAEHYYPGMNLHE